VAHQMPPGYAPPMPGGPAVASIARRAGGFLVDFVLLALVSVALGVAFHVPGIQTTTTIVAGETTTSLVLWNAGLVWVVFAIVSLGYAAGMWVASAATVGQRMLALHVYQAAGPQPLGFEPAVMLWATLWGVFAGLGACGGVAPAAAGVLGLLQLGWLAVLIVTTIRSPTKQGFHDRLAESVVVRG